MMALIPNSTFLQIVSSASFNICFLIFKKLSFSQINLTSELFVRERQNKAKLFLEWGSIHSAPQWFVFFLLSFLFSSFFSLSYLLLFLYSFCLFFYGLLFLIFPFFSLFLALWFSSFFAFVSPSFLYSYLFIFSLVVFFIPPFIFPFTSFPFPTSVCLFLLLFSYLFVYFLIYVCCLSTLAYYMFLKICESQIIWKSNNKHITGIL